MSRTYELQATIYGGQTVTRTRDFHNMNPTDRKEVGYHQHGQGSYYQCVALLFDQAELTNLRSKTIESITLSFGSTSFSYRYQVQWGEKETDSITDFTIGDYTLTDVERYATMPDFVMDSLPEYGYVFGGYYQTYTWSTISSATLTVVTNEVSKELSYNANGGQNAPGTQIGWSVGNYTFTITDATPTRTGYAFASWNTQADGTGTNYDPSDTITVSTDTVLYAQWTALKSILNPVSSTDIGASASISWTAQGTFEHKLTVSFGSSSSSEITVTAGTNAYSYTIPLAWLSELPTTTSGTATVTLTTVADGVPIGSDSVTFTVTVPVSVVPSIGGTSTEKVNTNPTVAGWNIFLQSFSQVQITASSLVAGTGSTLSTIRFTGQDMDITLSVTGATMSATSNTITASGALTYTVTLTDSRGRSSSSQITINVTAYSPPTVTYIQGWRCDSDGTVNPITGESLKAQVRFTYTAVGTNTVTNSLTYKKTSEQTWSTAGTNLASDAVTLFAVNTADIASTYNVQFTITDSLYNTTTVYITISSVIGIAFGLKNDRARFGGAVRQPGLEVDWNTQINGNLKCPTLTIGSTTITEAQLIQLLNLLGG